MSKDVIEWVCQECGVSPDSLFRVFTLNHYRLTVCKRYVCEKCKDREDAR